MSKNVIINGRKFETYENYEGELVVKRALGNSNFLVSELEELGITVEEVKPKFEDLPPGHYASPRPDWGNSVVFSKSTPGNWYSTAHAPGVEERAKDWFQQGKLKPLAWAEATE